MSVLIKGGRIVDPANQIDGEADVLIDEGKIVRVDKGITGAQQVIEAKDLLVIPGLIDLHTHLREPGEEYKEDIDSGTRAAAAGGFTAVCCMPNTQPVNDNRAVTELIVRRAQQLNRVHVYPIGAASRGLEGKVLAEYADMKEAGIVAVSDDGRCIMDAGLMRRVLEYAATFNLPVIQHCEDLNLSNRGAMNEGVMSTRAGLSVQPPQAESTIVARDIELVELTGARYHVAHISTRSSLQHVRQAKAKGLPVTCEVTPHHFTLTDEACLTYDTMTKVNPPLRTGDDRQALREAIADGIIDVIATDHAPHSVMEKEVEYGLAAFGISGLETAIPLALALWRDKIVSLEKLIAMMTCNPARILNLPGGKLSPGDPADITLIDVNREWQVDSAAFHSRGHNTPFQGWKMRGATVMTVIKGEVVFAL